MIAHVRRHHHCASLDFYDPSIARRFAQDTNTLIRFPPGTWERSYLTFQQMAYERRWHVRVISFCQRVWRAVKGVFVSLYALFCRPSPIISPARVGTSRRVTFSPIDAEIKMPLVLCGSVRLQPNLLAEVKWHDLRLYDNALYIGFDEKGRLRFGSHVQNNREALQMMFRATYGARLTERVVQDIADDGKDLPVTVEMLRKMLVITAAKVTISDIKELYAQIKRHAASHKKEDLVWGVARMLTQEQLKEISSAISFKKLTPEQLNILVKAFRTVPTLRRGFLPVLEAVLTVKERCGITALPAGFWFNDAVQLLRGFDALEKMSISDHADLVIAEYFAKHLAYRRLYPGMIAPGRRSDGSADYFICQGRLPKSFQVFSTIWTSWQDPRHCHLIFRGTQYKSHVEGSGTSLANNIDPAGIAKGAFYKERAALLRMVEKVIVKEGGIATLYIHGHSQGAIFAQRMLLASLQQLVSKYLEPGILLDVEVTVDPLLQDLWQQVSAIKVYCHNAPAVEHSCNRALKDVIGKLQKERTIIPVTLNFLYFVGDTIQNFGDYYLGDSIEEIERSVYYFQDPRLANPSTLALHKSRGLLRPTARFDMREAHGAETRSFYERSWAQVVAGYALPPVKMIFHYLAIGVMELVTSREPFAHRAEGRFDV